MKISSLITGIYITVVMLIGISDARWYDSETGKFTSRDPLEERGGANLYRFNANNPVNYIDPYGLDPVIPYREYVIDRGFIAPRGAGEVNQATRCHVNTHRDQMENLKQALILGSLIAVGAPEFMGVGSVSALSSASTSTLEQTAVLLELIAASKGQAAVRIMENMAATQAGRGELLLIHQTVSKLLPHALSTNAANIMLTLQQVSGTLARGGK